MSQSVDRVLRILELIGERPRSLAGVASELGVHKSTVLRNLQTLEVRGFVTKGSGGVYRVGHRVVYLAQRALEEIDVLAVAHPRLVRLSEELGHTLHLAQRIGESVIYIDKVDGRGAVKMYSRVGVAAPLLTSGVGKVILAFQPTEIASRMLDTINFQRYTANTIRNRNALEKELERIRDRGWAEDDGEFEEAINCVAVPIRDSSGSVEFAMSITAVRSLASLDVLRNWVGKLEEAVASIESEVGWRPSAVERLSERKDLNG